MRFHMLFFFNDTATTEIYTLSLHDALPICPEIWEQVGERLDAVVVATGTGGTLTGIARYITPRKSSVRYVLIDPVDRKSTRLNSSHGYISYAVFCLKKKNIQAYINNDTRTH